MMAKSVTALARAAPAVLLLLFSPTLSRNRLVSAAMKFVVDVVAFDPAAMDGIALAVVRHAVAVASHARGGGGGGP